MIVVNYKDRDMKVSIPIAGITSHPNHKDGESSLKVNLRPHSGYHKPVAPRKVIAELSNDYDHLFVHRGNGYENWIGITPYFIHKRADTDNPLLIFTAVDGEEIKVDHIEAIGNVLVVHTQSGTHYLLYKNGEYKNLGQIPSLPRVDVANTNPVTMTRTYREVYSAAPDDESMLEMTKGMVAEMVHDKEEELYLHDAVVLRYAFRLYDGSVIKHSPPILVMPQHHYRDFGKAKLYKDSNGFTDQSYIELLFYKMNLTYDFSSLEDWKDIIKSVDFFVSANVGLTWTDLIADGFWRGVGTGAPSGGVTIHIYEADGKTKYSRPPERGTGESTSGNRDSTVATRPDRGGADRESFRDGGADTALRTGTSIYSDAKEKVINASQFYLYYSEDNFEEGHKVMTFPSAKSTVKKRHANIIHQELMPNDAYTHHYYEPLQTNTYNSRLRYIGYSQYLSMPFSSSWFKATQKYNGEQDQGVEGEVRIAVVINTEQGEKTVISELAFSPYLSSMLSYPDDRARKMTFYLKTSRGNWRAIETFELTPHPTLNIAYYIADDLKPINLNLASPSPGAGEGVPSTNNRLEYPSTIRVSETSNPFYFPVKNSYYIQAGRILAESTIAMNVTDRNYGTHPMFVFTDQGIFTMAGQTAETVHASIQAPTFMEPPISRITAATPHGVVFVTRRGLMMINQHSTQFLSPQLQLPVDNILIDRTPYTVDAMRIEPASFMEYLEDLQAIVYDPYQDELIVSSSGYEYSYVYNFEQQEYYMTTETIVKMVEGAYPRLYALRDRELIDFAQNGAQTAEVALITRPLLFGTPDVKDIERFTLRSLLTHTTKLQMALYSAMDGRSYTALKGHAYSDGNYKDLDLGLLSRITYRQFIVALSGEVGIESEIQLLDFEAEHRYNDTKLR